MQRSRKLIGVLLICAIAIPLLLWLLLSRWIDRLHGNVPIVFYGHVVDEQGNGLPGVRVSAEALTVVWFTPLTVYNVQYNSQPLETTTDGEGRFELQAYGQRLTQIAKHKEGWRSVPGIVSTTFFYPPRPDYPPGHLPRPDDPDNPVTYVMRPKR